MVLTIVLMVTVICTTKAVDFNYDPKLDCDMLLYLCLGVVF